jgi:multidrug efflux pump subunit AcrB
MSRFFWFAAVLGATALGVISCRSDFASAKPKKVTSPQNDLPIIYVAQPSKGMDPVQLKDLISNYYVYHFRFIKGVNRVEATYAHEGAGIRLFLDPASDSDKVMDEAVNYIKRSRPFLPPGFPPATVLRMETMEVPALSLSIPIFVGKSVP